MNVKLCISLAISIFAYFHTFTFAYCGDLSGGALAKAEAAALLPIIPQPTEWKPAAGECDLAAAKVEAKVDASSALGEEGYTMKIAPGAITVVAGGDTGAVWARQTLAQLKASGAKAKCGTIRDIPKYRVRAFMMDVGRMYHSMDFLYDLAKTMSYYKMNVLHIHLNDNAGGRDPNKYAAFRLESETYPELTAKDGHYTKKEFREFMLYCKSIGVTVIPEIDVPAHSLAFTRVRPDFASKKYGADHLDLDKSDEILAWLKPLFAEYMTGKDPTFAGPYVHVGTDEYNKKESEKFRAFTDAMLKMVIGFGYKPCAWGALSHASGKTPVIASRDITMDIWNNRYYHPEVALKAGYTVVSIPDKIVYLVPFGGYYNDYFDCRKIYETWDPTVQWRYKIPEKYFSQLAGGKFALWNDLCGKKKDGTPYTEADNWDRIHPALQTFSQKMWCGGEGNPPWERFSAIADSLNEPAGVKSTHLRKLAVKFSFGGERGEEFLMNGKPFQIRGGELMPQRIPREYWRHRIQMCKAMGLNAISCYFAWNGFERPDGSFDFKSGRRDVAAFLRICKEEGMWVLFRPGPYICGEWDFGGLPSRFLKNDVLVRTTDPRYLAEAMKYLAAIADVAEPFLAKNGGPIILTQIENEYGSWPYKDIAYLRQIGDFWKKRGFGPFYMADGYSDGHLKHLPYPDKEIAVGFDPAKNEGTWNQARKFNPGVPFLSAETYPGWLRHWGEGDWRPSNISGAIKWFMEKRRSFCLFVAHGGTNFGFTAGANDAGREDGYQPDLTSYDYGAPIDEQGRPRKEYFAYRDIIFKALGEDPPAVPEEIRSIGFPAIVPRRFANLRGNAAPERKFETPPTFEELGQNQGIVFYRTTLPAGDTATLWFDRLADYAQILVGGCRVATADRRNGRPFVSIPKRDKPVELEIVVEAMGHINFGKGMMFDEKGIVGEVRLGGVVLKNWRVATLPLTEESVVSAKGTLKDAFAGGHFRALLKLDNVADTYIDMSKWNKGMLYVNGHNLGRYWKIGPQLSLYCPAPFLKKGENRIDIIELELSNPQPIRGLARPITSQSKQNTKNAANEW